MYHVCRRHLREQRCCHLLFPPRQRCDLVAEPAGGEQGIDDELVGSRQKLRFGRYCVGMNTLIFRPQGHRRWNARVPIQLAKNPLENPLEISYTGKTPKMGSLEMPQNQIWISSGFSSGFLANWIGTQGNVQPDPSGHLQGFVWWTDSDRLIARQHNFEIWTSLQTYNKISTDRMDHAVCIRSLSWSEEMDYQNKETGHTQEPRHTWDIKEMWQHVFK